MTTLELDTAIAEKLMGWVTLPNMKLAGAYWDPRSKRTRQIFNGAMYLKRLDMHEKQRRPAANRSPAPSSCKSPQ